ncbi:MAG: NAD-dependent succinate-semialdehyde dehydrogenase, partial [Balneolaceae bacterium]|nr:NAD-dependent succinate-semialdehyde dehydrogenase [Balneolaceae bacterium]
MKSINPATGKVIKEYELMDDGVIDAIIQKASAAQKEWARLSFSERAKRLNAVAKRLKSDSDELAELMAREMGKPLPQGISEAEKCAWVCDYYAEHAESFLSNRPVETDASASYITYNPLGTVLAIMPWNFPFWQVFRFGAPALMAGNAVILKHAPNVTGCALAIESLLHESGVPNALFRTVLADVDQTQQMIRHPDIQAVTLTGSTRAGKAVASQAGSMLKKTVLELGGSDPYIVLEDADLEQAVETCVTSRLLNSGQSCIAAKRFIVVESLYEEFKDRLIDQMEQKVVGNPLDKETDVGPMARVDLRDELHRQVKESVEQGADLLIGGELPQSEGAYYPVTALANIHKGMPAYEEELFGPVASLLRVMDEEEAI